MADRFLTRFTTAGDEHVGTNPCGTGGCGFWSADGYIALVGDSLWHRAFAAARRKQQRPCCGILSRRQGACLFRSLARYSALGPATRQGGAATYWIRG